MRPLHATNHAITRVGNEYVITFENRARETSVKFGVRLGIDLITELQSMILVDTARAEPPEIHHGNGGDYPSMLT